MDATMDICGLCVNTVKMDNERSRRLARRNGSEPARHQWVVVTAANAWDVLDGETHYSSSPGACIGGGCQRRRETGGCTPFPARHTSLVRGSSRSMIMPRELLASSDLDIWKHASR